MFILDSLLIGGLRFVLDKVAVAADQELNDETRLREELLDAQMRLELGEITDEEFAEVEAAVLRRIHEIRRAGRDPEAGPEGDFRVTGVEVSAGGDEDE